MRRAPCAAALSGAGCRFCCWRLCAAASAGAAGFVAIFPACRRSWWNGLFLSASLVCSAVVAVFLLLRFCLRRLARRIAVDRLVGSRAGNAAAGSRRPCQRSAAGHASWLPFSVSACILRLGNNAFAGVDSGELVWRSGKGEGGRALASATEAQAAAWSG